MNRRARIVFHLLSPSAAVAVLCLLGCQNDVTPPVQANLTGEYVGTYSWSADSLGQPPEIQPVTWTFSNGYSMYLDTARLPEASRVFCDVQGTYELTDAIFLHQLRSNLGADICDSTKNPTGRFVALMHNADTLSMVQIISSVTKRIELGVKKP